MNLKQKVVLITGASDGIGAACARSFLRRGASLSLTARSEEKLRRVGPEDALRITGDLTVPAVRHRVVAATLDRFGRIDVLVNNAGVGMYSPSLATPDHAVRAMFELNFFAALDLIRMVEPPMRAQGGGVVANVGSMAGKIPLPWLTLYSASKYALGSLTDALRMELRGSGIHFLTVCPGYVKTDFGAHMLHGRAPWSVRPGGRFSVTADECAEAVARGVERRARTVVTPAIGWLFIALARVLPGLVDRFMGRMYSSPQTAP